MRDILQSRIRTSVWLCSQRKGNLREWNLHSCWCKRPEKGQIVAPDIQPERDRLRQASPAAKSDIWHGDAASFMSMMNSKYWCRSLPTSTELKSSPNNKNLPMVNRLEAIQTYCILINCIDWHRLSSIKKIHYWCGGSAQNIPIGASLVKSQLPLQ